MSLHMCRVAILALLTALAACSGKDGGDAGSSAGAGEAASTTAVQDKDWLAEWREGASAGKDGAKTWERFSQAAQAELSKPGADPSDITARAQALGNDPQKIFEFVRDRIALEPYAGVLRGARGALTAGAGNALDRALLSQQLLRAGGVETRLVSGSLSDERATELLNRFLARNPVPAALADLLKPADEAKLKSEAARLAGISGLPEEKFSELLEYSAAQGRKFWAAADSQRARSYEQLNSRLRGGKVNMSVDRATLAATLGERLRKHYWLQVRGPDGAWSDFDTAFVDAERGSSHGTQPVPVAEVAKEDFHRLEFSLVYQTMMDGTPQERVLVAGSFASADSLFEPLEFRILPVEMTASSDELLNMDFAKKVEALKGIKRFQATLRSGTDISASPLFDLQGNTYEDTAPLLPVSGGTLVDAFGGGGESTPQFLELRVVMKLTGPGRQPMSQVRTLVRSRDTQSPTFAPPVLEWELLLQPQWVSAELVGHRAVSQVVAIGNARAKADAASQSPTVAEPPPNALALPLQVALLRQMAAAGILAEQTGVRALVDEPMLMISGYRLSAIHEDKGRIMAERSIDIVENAVRYVPGNDAAEAAAYDAALRQSVADATLEDRFLREVFPGTDTQSGTAIFESAVTAERPALLAKVQDIDAMRSAGMTESDIEWVYDNERPDARLLFATAGDSRDAWWSVRPDGNAVLRTNGGRGSALTEYALKVTKVSFATLCVIQFGLTEYNSQQQADGLWSEEGSERVAECMIATGLAGGLFAGGLALHALHWGSLALALYELHHLWDGAF